MKAQRRSSLFLIIALLIWLLANAGRVRESASDALRLCAVSVIPALFPFLVVTGLLMSLGFGAWASPILAPLMTGLYRLPGAAGSALLLGFLGGYPVGARTAAELYRRGQLTKDETERLLTFCNNANPAFLMSVLGAGVFGSTRTGIALLLIHVLSAFLTGLVFRHASDTPPARRDPPPLQDAQGAFFAAFVDAVGNAASAMLRICAFVAFFYVLAQPLKNWDSPAAAPLVGALELFSLTPMLTPDWRGFVLASICAAWGGLSALGQTAAALDAAGLSVRPCLRGKAVQALFAGLLAALASAVLQF
ncbi:MAG: sporulation protein [Oscillospiraceae bacterium]|nr:sporulation protein [Oscillospiraceae bacterium]